MPERTTALRSGTDSPVRHVRTTPYGWLAGLAVNALRSFTAALPPQFHLAHPLTLRNWWLHFPADLYLSDKALYRASWVNVGYCFDVGRGVRRSPARALFWYRKAASTGDGAAASNIGTVYRDEGRPRLAARWFQKAVSLGDTGALLHLAKLYLGPLDDRAKARSALARVARARDVTENSREQAEALLSRMQENPKANTQARIQRGR